MKTQPFFILVLSLFLNLNARAQDTPLYQVSLYNDGTDMLATFISLSDNHPLSDHPDSLAIPNLESEDRNEVKVIKLDEVYRKRLLSGMGISESDQVFIYDYEVDKEISFNVKDLEVAAVLNNYATDDDWPYSQYDYQFGFRPTEMQLDKLGLFYTKTFVAIGQKSPFVAGKLKPIKWKNTGAEEFFEFWGNDILAMDSLIFMRIDDIEAGYTCTSEDVYSFKTKEYIYYLMNYKTPAGPVGHYLLVMKKRTNEILYEQVYMESESTALTLLNSIETEEDNVLYEQWTGEVFKNKPPVVFGFEYYSFGCPVISFLNKSEPDIYINCDNRH
jgi:hypothetical protein